VVGRPPAGLHWPHSLMALSAGRAWAAFVDPPLGRGSLAPDWWKANSLPKINPSVGTKEQQHRKREDSDPLHVHACSFPLGRLGLCNFLRVWMVVARMREGRTDQHLPTLTCHCFVAQLPRANDDILDNFIWMKGSLYGPLTLPKSN
jgi:hypothetical protein